MEEEELPREGDRESETEREGFGAVENVSLSV